MAFSKRYVALNLDRWLKYDRENEQRGGCLKIGFLGLFETALFRDFLCLSL